MSTGSRYYPNLYKDSVSLMTVSAKVMAVPGIEAASVVMASASNVENLARGGLGNFEEVYIDEGEASFIDVIRILRDTGYAWSICPDHVPTHADDPGGYQAFAQAFGYIKGMIDSANSEVAT